MTFKDLRESLIKLKFPDYEKTERQTIQRLDISGQFGGTPNFMLAPPKEQLVEKYFHPDNISSSEKPKHELKKVRDEFKMSESDCGSARVQELGLRYMQLIYIQEKRREKGSGLHRVDLLNFVTDFRWQDFIPMASNKGFDGRRDLIEAYVALQHIVSSMNYTCGVYIVVLHAALERFEATRKISRNPNPFKQQLDHLNRLVRDNDIDCHEQLRMNRHTFMRLCGLIRTKGVSDSKYVVLEEKVAMFLTVLGHHHKNRNVKFNFMRSGQTVSKYFNDVLKAVLRLQGVLLKTPEPITAGCTDDRWRWFQNCLGALDGTYVRVLAPAVDKARYRSRKGEIATNVLGVCSHDMQFIYVLPGWEGSASDSRVLP